MPSKTQILPKWSFPHVHIETHDNTEVVDVPVADRDDTYKFIAVTRSNMGIDNKLIRVNSVDQYRKLFGNQDYAKYGQPSLMPIAMLANGVSSVNVMRIMPDDAFAANCVLSACYKEDGSDKFKVWFKAESITKDAMGGEQHHKTNELMKASLATHARGLKNDNQDGYKVLPLMTFRITGRGIYGNNYRWRISRNLEYEKNLGIKTYTFEVLNSLYGINKETQYVGSLVTSERYNELTLINDIIENLDENTLLADVNVFEDNVELLYEEYKKFIKTHHSAELDKVPALDQFDPLFGFKMVEGVKSNEKYDKYEIETETHQGLVLVDAPTGIPFTSGDDGKFANTDLQQLEKDVTASYVAAFTGKLDRRILSARQIQADVLLDAGYPDEVKKALALLGKMRNDCPVYIDAGTDFQLGELDQFIEFTKGYTDKMYSKEITTLDVRDITSKKKCKVTYTYHLALALPVHVKTNGFHVPFVRDYAVLFGHEKNSVYPVIDDIDNELKEKLYNARINFLEVISENKYHRAVQNTALPINSDLLEENNVRTFFELKRSIQNDVGSGIYNFTDAEERIRFTRTMKAKYANWEGRQLDTFNIVFKVNKHEAERSQLHCYVNIRFRNLSKTIIAEIDIDKRNFLG